MGSSPIWVILGAWPCSLMEEYFADNEKMVVQFHSGLLSTGNTFGQTHGAWHIVSACESYKEAEEVMDSINNNTYEGYDPWKGYFEKLENVTIERINIWK